MNVAVLNKTTNADLTASVLGQIVAAIQKQLDRDYADLWQEAGIPCRVIGSEAEAGTDDALVVIIGDPPSPDELGDHSTTQAGRPQAEVALNPILANGGTLYQGDLCLSATLSHEILEMRRNPFIQLYSRRETGEWEPFEACDRVEHDSYAIDGVSVSNFLGPRAFSVGEGPYDFLQLMKTYNEIRPGGYVSLISADGQSVNQTFGEKFPKWKMESKRRKVRRMMRIIELR